MALLALHADHARYDRTLHVEVEPGGRVLVHDGFDNSVLEVDRSGQVTERGVFSGYQELALDPSGALLAARVSSPSDTTAFTLWRADAGTHREARAGELKLDYSGSNVSMVGADAKGGMYIEVARGPNEAPTDHAIWVVTPGHAATRLTVPARPWRFEMARSRAILPGGGVLTCEDTPAGLALEAHPLPATAGR